MFFPDWSNKAGIFEFGFTSTKPLPNWSPSIIEILYKSYSASLIPNANNSSNKIVTLIPFGVPREYNWNGFSPLGNTCSKRLPAVGRLIPENFYLKQSTKKRQKDTTYAIM